ncbi:MAG: hypothetical protein ACI8R4_004136 [Paracoccaceae bacterium]|jgi:hypothetical protein
MAISLMMGGLVSTLLTLVVIPLGCGNFSQALTGEDNDGGNGPSGTPPNPTCPGVCGLGVCGLGV